MKQCPNCKTTYADDSLVFCLNDGATLTSVSGAATVQMSFDRNPMRVPIAPDSVPTYFSPQVSPPPPPQPVKTGVSPIIVGVLGLLLLLVIGGFAAFILLRPTADKNPVVAVSPSPTVSQTPKSDDETAKLKEEMANLQKQIKDQKNQKPTPTGETFSPPKQTTQTAATARANSPRDGFLALRSEPNSETGYRVTKIPHGATLTVFGCPKPSNSGKIAGRWCQVIYNGQSGWAFDAFMTF